MEEKQAEPKIDMKVLDAMTRKVLQYRPPRNRKPSAKPKERQNP